MDMDAPDSWAEEPHLTNSSTTWATWNTDRTPKEKSWDQPSTSRDNTNSVWLQQVEWNKPQKTTSEPAIPAVKTTTSLKLARCKWDPLRINWWARDVTHTTKDPATSQVATLLTIPQCHTGLTLLKGAEWCIKTPLPATETTSKTTISSTTSATTRWSCHVTNPTEECDNLLHPMDRSPPRTTLSRSHKIMLKEVMTIRPTGPTDNSKNATKTCKLREHSSRHAPCMEKSQATTSTRRPWLSWLLKLTPMPKAATCSSSTWKTWPRHPRKSTTSSSSSRLPTRWLPVWAPNKIWESPAFLFLHQP